MVTMDPIYESAEEDEMHNEDLKETTMCSLTKIQVPDTEYSAKPAQTLCTLDFSIEERMSSTEYQNSGCDSTRETKSVDDIETRSTTPIASPKTAVKQEQWDSNMPRVPVGFLQKGQTIAVPLSVAQALHYAADEHETRKILKEVGQIDFPSPDGEPPDSVVLDHKTDESDDLSSACSSSDISAVSFLQKEKFVTPKDSQVLGSYAMPTIASEQRSCTAQLKDNRSVAVFPEKTFPTSASYERRQRTSDADLQRRASAIVDRVLQSFDTKMSSSSSTVLSSPVESHLMKITESLDSSFSTAQKRGRQLGSDPQHQRRAPSVPHTSSTLLCEPISPLDKRLTELIHLLEMKEAQLRQLASRKQHRPTTPPPLSSLRKKKRKSQQQQQQVSEGTAGSRGRRCETCEPKEKQDNTHQTASPQVVLKPPVLIPDIDGAPWSSQQKSNPERMWIAQLRSSSPLDVSRRQPSGNASHHSAGSNTVSSITVTPANTHSSTACTPLTIHSKSDPASEVATPVSLSSPSVATTSCYTSSVPSRVMSSAPSQTVNVSPEDSMPIALQPATTVSLAHEQTALAGAAPPVATLQRFPAATATTFQSSSRGVSPLSRPCQPPHRVLDPPAILGKPLRSADMQSLSLSVPSPSTLQPPYPLMPTSFNTSCSSSATAASIPREVPSQRSVSPVYTSLHPSRHIVTPSPVRVQPHLASPQKQLQPQRNVAPTWSFGLQRSAKPPYVTSKAFSDLIESRVKNDECEEPPLRVLPKPPTSTLQSASETTLPLLMRSAFAPQRLTSGTTFSYGSLPLTSSFSPTLPHYYYALPHPTMSQQQEQHAFGTASGT